MNHEDVKNIYDDGNIPDSDLPERKNPSNGQNCSGSNTKNDYKSKEQSSFQYNPGQNSDTDPGSSPQQAPLTWVTPPVLLAETDDLQPDAPGIL
ncbi:MAG: hypothetical protein HFI70_12935 [Lachnospiraceae bacterium]|nr:hypothetical protein [Lachnospiraceae bacterium]